MDGRARESEEKNSMSLTTQGIPERLECVAVSQWVFNRLVTEIDIREDVDGSISVEVRRIEDDRTIHVRVL